MTTQPSTTELKSLQLAIEAKRKEFEEGVKNDMIFEEVKKIYMELKTLEKQLDLYFHIHQ